MSQAVCMLHVNAKRERWRNQRNLLPRRTQEQVNPISSYAGGKTIDVL